MVRIAVDDAPIHGSHHIDLVRNQLEGQLRRVVDKLSLDDVYGIKLVDTGLQRLLSGDAFVDGGAELLKNLVAQQRPQDRFVASCESRDDHFESGARTLDKMRWIKTRIGTAKSAKPLGNCVGRRPVIGRPRGALVGFNKGCYVVGRGWRGAPWKEVAAALISRPTAENA